MSTSVKVGFSQTEVRGEMGKFYTDDADIVNTGLKVGFKSEVSINP